MWRSSSGWLDDLTCSQPVLARDDSRLEALCLPACSRLLGWGQTKVWCLLAICRPSLSALCHNVSVKRNRVTAFLVCFTFQPTLESLVRLFPSLRLTGNQIFCFHQIPVVLYQKLTGLCDNEWDLTSQKPLLEMCHRLCLHQKRANQNPLPGLKTELNHLTLHNQSSGFYCFERFYWLSGSVFFIFY